MSVSAFACVTMGIPLENVITTDVYERPVSIFDPDTGEEKKIKTRQLRVRAFGAEIPLSEDKKPNWVEEFGTRRPNWVEEFGTRRARREFGLCRRQDVLSFLHIPGCHEEDDLPYIVEHYVYSEQHQFQMRGIYGISVANDSSGGNTWDVITQEAIDAARKKMAKYLKRLGCDETPELIVKAMLG